MLNRGVSGENDVGQKRTLIIFCKPSMAFSLAAGSFLGLLAFPAF